MPIEMKYCWTKNNISCDTVTGISAYSAPTEMKTTCNVYTWGNVDAFGSMALIWLPSEIVNQTLEEEISTIIHPEKTPQHRIEYVKVQKIVEHKLSGWHSCINRNLIPSNN